MEKLNFWGIAALVAIMGLLMAGCPDPNGGDPTGDPSPTAADFTISGVDTEYEKGDTVSVSIIPKANKSDGTITIYYAGIDGTTYPKSTNKPTAVGKYAVSFDVAAATGWKAASGLSAGTLTINPADPNKVVMPSATPPAGEVESGATVTLSTTTDGAEIWYTTDGNTPEKDGATSTKYVSPIVITADVTIKAIAVKDDMTDSNILTAAYTIDTGAPCTHQWEWVVTDPATLTEDGEEIETCSICEETRGEPRTILSLKSILEAAEGGDSADDPITVPLILDLGNMPDAGSNWIGLLAALDEAGKYVSLDLSGCTLTGTTFNTGVTVSSKPNGMDYIVSIILPDSVRSISDNAFVNCRSLESVIIPDNVTSIGRSTFFNCSNLATVIIGGGVDYIGNQVFQDCTSLTNVTIPDSVESIGPETFRGCTSLASITIPNSVMWIGYGVFKDCTSLTSVIIPDSVETIGNGAFAGCTSMESVTIGGNVTLSNGNLFDSAYNDTCGKAPGTYTRENGSSEEWIWKGGNGAGFIVAFHSNGGTYVDAYTGLQSGANVNAPTAPTKEGYTFGAWYMDSNCTAAASFSITVTDDIILYAGWAYGGSPLYDWITEQTGGDSPDDPVVIPKDQLEADLGDMTQAGSNWNKLLLNLAEAGKYVSLDLSACTLTGTTFNTGVTDISKPYGMDNIVSIILPNSVTSIGGYYAFKDCTGLTSVTIPDSVTSIGDGAFWGCTGLTSVDIPDSVTSIGDYAFLNCTSLASVIIGDSVTSIGSSAFLNCTSLASVIIPDGVTRIGINAFYGCISLESVTIPDSVTSIGAGTFQNCTSLESVTIPDSVESIGNQAFGDCSSLESVTIPDSVTSIGNQAFWGCTLTSVDIPDNVTSIGNQAFFNCTSLTAVTCLVEEPPALGTDVFRNTDSALAIKVPAGSVEAYQAAENWSAYAERISAIE